MASRSAKYKNDKLEKKPNQPTEYVTKHAGVVREEVVIHKRRKLKVFNIFLFIVILLVLYCAAYLLVEIDYKNIYISGNSVYKDQEIIELAGLEDYPSILKNNFYVIKKRLKKSDYIIDATVKHQFLAVHIIIEENTPMYYDLGTEKTVLKDGRKVSEEFNVPILINYIPDNIYDLFFEEYKKLDKSVLLKISEIKYDPNDVDKERFYLTMTDGNYVYLTLDRFDKINKYLSIVKNFENKNGTLYLDSGEYFEINQN